MLYVAVEAGPVASLKVSLLKGPRSAMVVMLYVAVEAGPVASLKVSLLKGPPSAMVVLTKLPSWSIECCAIEVQA